MPVYSAFFCRIVWMPMPVLLLLHLFCNYFRFV